MLQQVHDASRREPRHPLSQEMIGKQLGLPAETNSAQLLATLVQRGRLVEVDEGCTGCAVCPLKVVCAGAPAIAMRGYALPDHKSEARAESA